MARSSQLLTQPIKKCVATEMNLYRITYITRAPQTHDHSDGFGDYCDWTEATAGTVEANNETEAKNKMLTFKPYYKDVKKTMQAILVA